MHNSATAGRVALVIALLSLVPLPAAAQPRAGQVALGADIGVFFPADDQLDSGLMADGFVEFYATPRVGLRQYF
jgi:hypothetical protein